MTIRIPDSLRDAEINIGVEIPQPEISIEKNKDGSMSLSAHYDMCDISEFAWHVANELNDDIEKAFIEDLLDLNGYIKERTCRAEQDYDAMEDGIPDCRIWRCSCGEAFPYWRGCFPEYCPNCGSKVIRNAD